MSAECLERQPSQPYPILLDPADLLTSWAKTTSSVFPRKQVLEVAWYLRGLVWAVHNPVALTSTVYSSGGQNDDFRPLTSTLGGEGHGVQGQICDILRPQLAMKCFLPLWQHRFPHFGYIYLGGGGVGGLWYRSMSSIRPICKCRCPPLVYRHLSQNARLWVR